MHFTQNRLRLRFGLVALLLTYSTAVYCVEARSVEVSSVEDSIVEELPLTLAGDVEVTVQRYPATGDSIVLWLSSSAGMQEAYQHIAELTAGQGIEVWLIDLLEAHFLPLANSSLYQLPASDIRILSEKARQTKAHVYWYTEGSAAVVVLRGLREWQLNHRDDAGLGGVIFNSPNLLQETPDPGQRGLLMPVATHSNLPIVILQPQKTPAYWQLDQTVPALEQGGSDVFVWLLRDVRARFHYRPDANAREQQLAQMLPHRIKEAVTLLQSVNHGNRVPEQITIPEAKVREGKKDRELQNYQGDPRPPPLELTSLTGLHYSLAQLKGRVVLVNFWATWCPPCVHEMPSLQALSRTFKPEQFLVLGVNMAESEADIHLFLKQKVAVDFPILLDRDGAALKRWQVYAFPTSYVVDKAGNIRLALFGSIQWDTPEVIGKINALLQE